MIDLTEILVTIITLVFSLISVKLIPYLKEKATKEQLETVRFWTLIAVDAAEMLYKDSGKGAQKKAYVEKFLRDKGYKLDTAEIESLIEAGVLELKIAVEEGQKCEKQLE